MSPLGGLARGGVDRFEHDNARPHYPLGVAMLATAFVQAEDAGKHRPVIVVTNRRELWMCIPLTSKGKGRVAVREWREIGLRRPGFFWPHLVPVPDEDFGSVTGPITPVTAGQGCRLVRLSESERAAFCDAVPLQGWS